MCMDDDHINLEPFFRDNISLKLAFEDGKIATGKKSRAFVDEKLPILKSILSKREVRAPGMFYTSGLPDMPLITSVRMNGQQGYVVAFKNLNLIVHSNIPQTTVEFRRLPRHSAWQRISKILFNVTLSLVPLISPLVHKTVS